MRFGSWKPYVPVAARKRASQREISRRTRSGLPLSPVVIDGRTIARTFWGKAWCENLEQYSDFESRLPRGRTYVRSGAVIDLVITAGEVSALVSGSSLYEVLITVKPLAPARWTSICADCAGAIDSLVELLQGRLSKGVMERIAAVETGLFPTVREIDLTCSCPDYAYMCKHVAAVLYGIGARLDTQPELLFRLRGVDAAELVAQAGRGLSLPAKGPGKGRVLEANDLSGLFGLELEADEAPPTPPTLVDAAPKASAAPKAKPAPRMRSVPPPTPAPPPEKPRPVLRSEDVAGLRDAIKNVEARLQTLRAEGGHARTISTLESWLINNRARLAGQ